METERDYGDWRDCGDQWRCSPRDKKRERDKYNGTAKIYKKLLQHNSPGYDSLK